MDTKIIIKYIRMAPRKVRMVLTAIKGKPAFDALAHLKLIPKKSARIAEKALRSAISSAKDKKMDENKIFIKEVRADGGPTFKRIMTRSMGRADRIIKRTTHLTMVLGEKEIAITNRAVAAPEKGEAKKKLIGSGSKKEKAGKASA